MCKPIDFFGQVSSREKSEKKMFTFLKIPVNRVKGEIINERKVDGSKGRLTKRLNDAKARGSQ